MSFRNFFELKSLYTLERQVLKCNYQKSLLKFNIKRGVKDEKKAVFAALILMILMILGNIFNANSVNAYQLIGFKWSNPDPVTYYLNGNTYTNSAFNSSINDWNNALPSGVSLQRVYNNFNVYAFDWHDSQDGRDGLFYMSGNEVYIALNRYHTDGYSPAQRRSVTAHEIGHSLGLDDENGEVCLMIGSTLIRWFMFYINTPQTDDLNGINALY